MFVLGTIKRTAAGFPPSLKDVTPEKVVVMFILVW